jgi:hypothetical protein
MPQGVLNFKLEPTDASMTSNSGLILFGEYCKAIGLDKMTAAAFPGPGSNRGYAPFMHLFPLVLMLHSGGRELSDLRRIHSDTALRDVLGLKRVPTAGATDKWLLRMHGQGNGALETVHRILLKRYMKQLGGEPLVLDIDATVIESHKSTACYTYKGVPGYTPMLGHINGGYLVGAEFRKGNIAPAADNPAFIKQCIDTLPEGKRIAWLRADSASYQSAVFNDCDAQGITFTIGGRLDRAVREAVDTIRKWKKVCTKEGDSHFYEEQAAEVLHTMHDADNAFRLIVIRKRATPIFPALRSLLDEATLEAYAREHYSVIATNADESIGIEEIIRFYRQRGDTSENRIKALKQGFNLDYLPTSDFNANAFYFQIGALAYNLFILFSKTLDSAWRRHKVETIRYKLYHLAGRVIRHAGAVILKVRSDVYEMMLAIRKKIAAEAAVPI